MILELRTIPEHHYTSHATPKYNIWSHSP